MKLSPWIKLTYPGNGLTYTDHCVLKALCYYLLWSLPQKYKPSNMNNTLDRVNDFL